MNYNYNDLGIFNFESTISDGEGIRITKKLLKEITYEMAKNAAKQIENTSYLPPFAYRERQIHTLFSPAFDKIADYFLMESPVNRKWTNETMNDNTAHGWVDYWCEYKKYYYFIEFKHGFVSQRTNKITSSIKENWDMAFKQLQSLEDEIGNEKEFAKGIFKIIIHVIPVYKYSKKSNITLDIDSNLMINEQKIMMEEISKEVPANWSGLWILNQKLCKEYSFINGFEKYPALYLLANVSEIEKK